MSKEARLKVLGNYAGIYGKHRLFKCKTSVEVIIELLNRSDKMPLVKLEFDNLLDTARTEFPSIKQDHGNDDYSRRCSDFLYGIIYDLLKTPQQNIIQNFTESLKIFSNLEKVVKPWWNPVEVGTRTPAKDIENVFTVMNSEYMNKVEGLFKNDLKMCYVWKNFSDVNPIRSLDVDNLRINELKQGLEKFYGGAGLFEGYSNHIRNAIAHATYTYNSKNETMEYRDEEANWSETLDPTGLMFLSEKIMILNFLVSDFFGILFTYDVVFCPKRNTT